MLLSFLFCVELFKPVDLTLLHFTSNGSLRAQHMSCKSPLSGVFYLPLHKGYVTLSLFLPFVYVNFGIGTRLR